jgi:hypothetical protein
MNRTYEPSDYSRKNYSRQTFILMLNAALDSGSLRFARQAALAWLSTYPGDLGVQLLLAKAFHAEKMLDQARSTLSTLVKKDPEFLEAWREFATILPESDPEKNQAANCLWALGEKPSRDVLLAEWSTAVQQARKLIVLSDFEEAEKLLYPVIGMSLDCPLPAVCHMQISSAQQDEAAVHQLAHLYHNRWPEVLQFKLELADTQLRLGEGILAVDLLHACAAEDTAAQIATRLWGKDNRYQQIWPELLEIDLDMAVPAEVAGLLGWNTLSAGTVAPVRSEPTQVTMPDPAASKSAFFEQKIVEDDTLEIEIPKDDLSLEFPTETAFQPEKNESTLVEEKKDSIKTKIPPQRPPKQFEDALRPVNEAFDALAKKLKMPSLARSDGRYPVYVILSTCAGLNKQYGAQTRLVIDREMRTLADAIRKRPGWGAMVFYPDDQATVSAQGMTPIDDIDPWKIKLSIMDLDKALAKKGAMIGALVIVGGHDVVPFHGLPNPTDDLDQQVFSDNPYATLDGNYFIPEWPIGRLPGEKGADAGLLLEQLRSITKYHNRSRQLEPWWTPLYTVFNFLSGFRGASKKASKGRGSKNFGYSAAVWRRSSLAVFRPIGDGAGVSISPPEDTSTIDSRLLTSSVLEYYNLHGMPDSAEWYGQRDVSDVSGGPEYPVAVSTHLLVKNGRSPRVVFSEACYGGYIFDKTEQDSIALRFIQIGALALVGSTAVAYGSISSPLIGADLLGNLFWKYLNEGRTVGESLMLAKVELSREMNRRQGYLDGEDQKTLLSFVLYGDPLMRIENFGLVAKNMSRMRNHLKFRTSMEMQPEDSQKTSVVITKEIIRGVKEALEPYLPGLDTARVSVSQQILSSNGDNKTGTGANGTNVEKREGNVVVTVEKEIKVANLTHHHFARISLDSQGKMVKLSLSR